MATHRIIFMGTPEYAVPSLEALISEKTFNVVAVFTQTDKPVGRKRTITPSPVKKIAKLNKIDLIFQPEKLTREYTHEIKNLSPDLIIVVAYGQILPKEILDLPTFGAVNVHFSLLPKYRGAAPAQSVILNGEKTTGSTIMLMEEELDTGPILSQKEILIGENETAGELLTRLSKLSTKQLISTIKKYLANKLKPVNQNDSLATYCFRSDISKEKARINWENPSEKIHNLVRAMNPWPIAWTKLNNKRVKIYRTKLVESNISGKLGTVFSNIDNNSMKIICGQGAIEILEIQLEGRDKIKGSEFLRGYGEIVFQ